MEIIKKSAVLELEKQAGSALASLLKKAPQNTLLLLSGGSALKMLEYVETPPHPSQVTIGVLDERFTKDLKENNFALLTETRLYKSLTAGGAKIIDTSKRFESVEELANTMDSSWKKWVAENPEGEILTTFGIGKDAHIAGIMPYAEDKGMFDIMFEDKERFVIGYDARGKHPVPLRATATLPFLRTHISAGIAFMVGVDKKIAFEKILSARHAVAETPAGILHEIEQITLFTDIAP